MNIDARINRRIVEEVEGRARSSEVVVAEGPLVIMVHGLVSLPPEARESCWISSAAGDLTAAEAERMLRHWSSGTHN